MKYLALALSLFAFNAFACPDITGNFTCKFKNRVSTRDIVKTEKGFTITADGVAQDYTTDGQIFEVPSNDSMKDGKYSSVCDGGNFVITFTATLLYEGAEIAKEIQKTTYFMNGNQLNIVQKTKAKGVPLPTINFVCERM